ncbi:DUF7694 domain-containing protein [Miniphocaeibacter massiliensis]|uniref:DUF7694 domain-containing protein n=1 Tax=Miniphocaeibacter massiliensis TaxID=2041841 RepID=UPI000C1BB73C|nr:hypothetical protein [Miniphocaeibacter massiliensis]
MKDIDEIKEKLKVKQEGKDGLCGHIKVPKGGTCFIVFSFGGGWEHCSVSKKSKTPTWDEMNYIKDIFFKEDETVVQYHPKKSNYVNLHEHCLHMWRPLEDELPEPPTIFV